METNSLVFDDKNIEINNKSTIILEDNIEYSKLIKEYRNKFKITQREFAKLIGAPFYFIPQWEYKNIKPNYEFCKKIKKILSESNNIIEVKECLNIIKEYRSKFHMTQKELANFLNVSEGTIRYWERGKGTPSSKSCKKIRMLINTSTETFKASNYANIIKQYRSKFNITQKELAKLIGVVESTINNWECKRCIPSFKFRKSIENLIL